MRCLARGELSRHWGAKTAPERLLTLFGVCSKNAASRYRSKQHPPITNQTLRKHSKPAASAATQPAASPLTRQQPSYKSGRRAPVARRSLQTSKQP